MAGDVSSLPSAKWMSQRCLETPCYSLTSVWGSLGHILLFQCFGSSNWNGRNSAGTCSPLRHHVQNSGRMGRCLECRFLEAEVNGWICLPPILSTFGLLHCTALLWALPSSTNFVTSSCSCNDSTHINRGWHSACRVPCEVCVKVFQMFPCKFMGRPQTPLRLEQGGCSNLAEMPQGQHVTLSPCRLQLRSERWERHSSCLHSKVMGMWSTTGTGMFQFTAFGCDSIWQKLGTPAETRRRWMTWPWMSSRAARWSWISILSAVLRMARKRNMETVWRPVMDTSKVLYMEKDVLSIPLLDSRSALQLQIRW